MIILVDYKAQLASFALFNFFLLKEVCNTITFFLHFLTVEIPYLRYLRIYNNYLRFSPISQAIKVFYATFRYLFSYTAQRQKSYAAG